MVLVILYHTDLITASRFFSDSSDSSSDDSDETVVAIKKETHVDVGTQSRRLRAVCKFRGHYDIVRAKSSSIALLFAQSRPGASAYPVNSHSAGLSSHPDFSVISYFCLYGIRGRRVLRCSDDRDI